MPREEGERRLGELRCLIKSRGHVLLVVEDLKWAAEFWSGHVQGGRRGYYCPVEHVVTEVRALACAAGGEHGLWLVGFGSYQTYTKCRAGQPSLENLWGLQTLTVPAGSLALSLTCALDDSALGAVNQSMKASSDMDGNGPVPRWPLLGGAQLTSRCCGDCSGVRIDTKAALPPSFVSSSTIPSWLQHCRDQVECRSRFKELNAENLKLLCAALEKEVPWQKEIVPEIASTVLQCRSGIAKRRDKSRSTDAKEETWMFFLGGDADGKERVARELANLVFGSRKNFVSIKLGASSTSASCSTEEHRSKRPRTSAATEGEAYLERLYDAVSENPHRVILMDDFEQADQYCQVGIKEAIDSGVIRSQTGDEVGVSDTIVILCCESFDSKSRACSPPTKQMRPETKEEHTVDDDHKEAETSSSCFDLNINIESEHADERDVCLLTAVDRTLFFRRREDL
ncbi:hypothetical protein TRIUR3_33347 [Triticum urartu]|uniref:Clp R domain-containing protein n=1 Tax=Triticum urartu TaxID=4572 RepID=M7Z464_TRIUA|nr:hypothetical protein TRIUR3_33347 [Triticum urartu]